MEPIHDCITPRVPTSAHVPGTAGRTGADNGASTSAGRTFGENASCPDDRDVRVYNEGAKALVLAPGEHRMTDSLRWAGRDLRNETGASVAAGSGSIFDYTPAIDTDVDGKRKRSMEDLDVVASKTGKHGDGASAATVCSRSWSRGQASVDRSVSAGHLQQRWRSAVAHQRAIAAEAGENVTKASPGLADSERLESGCRDSSGSEGRRAHDAGADAAEHGRLWGGAQAQFDGLVEAQPCEDADEIMTPTAEVVQEVFRRAGHYLSIKDPGEMADTVDTFGSDLEEASDWSQSDVEVPASVPTPVCLPVLTGWNRYSPGQFFKVALREKAIIAAAEEQRKKDAETAEKAKNAAAEKKAAKATKAAKAAAEKKAGGMAVGRGHSGPSEGARGVKRQAEGGQSDEGAGAIRRSTRESRPTPAKELEQQQKRERLHTKQRAWCSCFVSENLLLKSCYCILTFLVFVAGQQQRLTAVLLYIMQYFVPGIR